MIELLVVIAIISLLVSILLPSLQQAKEMARSVVCMSNLKNIGLGIVQYAGDNDGKMCRSWDAHWWPNALGLHGYMPLPAGFSGEDRDKTTQDVWNCPTVVQLHLPSGSVHSSWTYLRMSNEYPFWTVCGTADWVKLDEIESPSNQIFVIDGLLTWEDLDTSSHYSYAGKINGAFTRYGLIVTEFAGSGGSSFDHPGVRANCLFSDWHVEALDRDSITQDMCDSPDP